MSDQESTVRPRRLSRSSPPPSVNASNVSIRDILMNHDSNSHHSSRNSSNGDVAEILVRNNSTHSSLHGDGRSIVLLVGLYILQGIPLGIAASIPYLLQSRKVSYSDQAVFSFVSWPFSLKLLWAPIVDSVYWGVMGRRKSWMVPTQYLIGIFMLVLSGSINHLMGDEPAPGEVKGEFNVVSLTAIFFTLNFLAATQDIAVDGWALNMLSKKNVGWVSTCNTVGQTVGFFLGNVVFLALESADFCNRYLRYEPLDRGVVTLPGFFRFWGVVFLVATTLVMIFKRERNYGGHVAFGKVSRDSSNGSLRTHHDSETEVDEEEQSSHDDDDCILVAGDGVIHAYRQLWRIMRLPSVMTLIAILLTMKMGFAAADAVTGLKLMEEGVPKEHLAMMAVPMIPIDIVLPVIITKYMSSDRPLDVLLRGYPFRLLLGLLLAFIVWWAPSTKTADSVYPAYFYALMLLVMAVHQVAVYTMYVPSMAFFAKVSDPVIGGTYMTLLNTVSNLGGVWPATATLTLVDRLTWKGCKNLTSGTECSYTDLPCAESLTSCTMIDGYYILSVACFFVGFIWLFFVGRKMRQLQDVPSRQWKCTR